MKPLNPKIHGVIDYLFAAFVLLSPSLFGFTGTTAASICYVVGSLHIVLSLVTAYPMGVFRYIPFPVHGAIELAAGIFLIATPWLFGYAADDTVRNLFLGSGIAVALVYALTNYNAAIGIRRYTGITEVESEKRKRAA